jgi:hypothetical protein
MNSAPVKSFNEAADRGSEDGALQRRAPSDNAGDALAVRLLVFAKKHQRLGDPGQW